LLNNLLRGVALLDAYRIVAGLGRGYGGWCGVLSTGLLIGGALIVQAGSAGAV
jgi:hypothetical protein